MCLLAFGPEAMEMVLVEASFDFVVPKGGATDGATFTDEDVVGAKFEA
jgi:hypothetical protein